MLHQCLFVIKIEFDDEIETVLSDQESSRTCWKAAEIFNKRHFDKQIINEFKALELVKIKIFT